MSEEKKDIRPEDVLKQLDEKFSIERKEISKYIFDNIINKMNDIGAVADIQVHISSQRQRLVDKTADLKALIRRKKSNIATIRKQKFRYYKLDYDIKLNDYEIPRHIDADVENTANVLSILDNQITHYQDTIATLDKIVYKIKYLIDVKKFLSGTF
jgi:hypothetical protein